MACFQQGWFLPPWWNSIKINNNNKLLPPKRSICMDSLNLNNCCADSAAMPLSVVSIVFLDHNTVGPIVYPGQPKGKVSSSLQNCWLCSVFPFCDPSIHERAILSFLGFILPPRTLCETNVIVIFMTLFLLLDQNLPWDRHMGFDLEVVSVGLSLLCQKSFSRAHSRMHLASVRHNGQFTVSISWLYVRCCPENSKCAVLLQRGHLCFSLKTGPPHSFHILLRSSILQSSGDMSLRLLFQVGRGRKLMSWVGTNVWVFPVFRRTQI